jgi:hypothetical protein
MKREVSEKPVEWHENVGPWELGVPSNLIPVLEHLRESFADAHWGAGQVTKLFCYARLHKQTADDPQNESLNYLVHIKTRVGAGATEQFHNLIRQNIAPSIYKGFHDLYVDNMAIEISRIFLELLEIGEANQARLPLLHVTWAETQAKHLIRSHNHQIKNWVRGVCDKQPFDPNDDTDECIFWTKWEAPKLLVMVPARAIPYDADEIWDRYGADASSSLLSSYAQNYVIRLEGVIRKAAGKAELENAKRPEPDRGNVVRTSTAAASVTERPKARSPRHEVRKLETEARHKRWRSEYKALKKRRPGMSDVWYSLQIANMKIAEGSSAETVRKNMKDGS